MQTVEDARSHEDASSYEGTFSYGGARLQLEWLGAVKAELAGLREVREIAECLTAKRSELIQHAAGLPGRQRTGLLSDLIDLLVQRMFEVACEPTDAHPSLRAKAEKSLTVVATGGYGRQELAPFSDVDINFISASDEDPEVDAITRSMFRLIMDVFLAEAKLKVGYAYRLVGEAGSLHHQNQTALLDARFVAGSRDVFQAFQDELRRNIHPVAYIHDKVRERESSIRLRGAAIYRVEPDIKEGEGSLRDLHLTSWLAQVACGFSNRTVWDDIRAHGLLTSAEVERVAGVQEFFSRIRWEMHLLAGQQADTLTVQKQEALAKQLGYEDKPEETGPERLMREYYAHAEVARQTAEKMMASARSLNLQLEPGLAARNGELALDNPEAFENDPVAALRAFAYCQRYGLTLSQRVIDALRLCAVRCPAPIADPDAAKVFVMILRSERVSDALVWMARCGILQWFLPEFKEVMGLVPSDAAHEFTVGWHSLMVVRYSEDLGASGDEDVRRIFASVRQPELLYLFALLHDIGKSGPSGGHSQRGAEMVRAISERLGLDEELIERLEFLVLHHLLMSDTARLRDLNLRKTVDDFVAVVNDVELLGIMYVFTQADILAVGSAAWSEIQGRFLRELYYRAERAIVNKSPVIDSDEDMDIYRRRVRRELSLTNLPPEAVEEHVTLMPAIYLLNTGPEDMASHIEFIRKASLGEPSTDFRSEPGSDFTELTLCVRDDPKPGLLSKIAAVLWAMDINVHAAQVFTRENSDKVALDTLYIDFEGKQLPEFKKHQLHRDLTRVLKGEIQVRQLLEDRHKKLRTDYSSLSVKIHNELSEQHSVIDVRAQDSPGLLFRITRAFADLGWDIHSARVSTWGAEARDSFYVTCDGVQVDVDTAGALETALQSV